MTALHVAATAGHTEIVEIRVEKMSPEDLEMKDTSGNIALTAAIIYNANIKIAECMVKKNKKLPTMVDQEETMPVVLAFQYCHVEMGRYLYSVALIEDLKLRANLKHAAELISQAIIVKCYGYPSGCLLKFRQKWIYEC
ncbi:uncharacterized protein LOC132805027 [Ziziphus jujuba]|uniref:Uncharacterized protein LOC132805027 n=1 Tax=Ziziphus jujuba TaxID=326968 RepID=A0ABM4AGA1_ZIZJJ|nr:uncharacterized protein LOC132805027 [Ziziphus jujuba]